jgi:hypothetical protein
MTAACDLGEFVKPFIAFALRKLAPLLAGSRLSQSYSRVVLKNKKSPPKGELFYKG